MSVILNAEATVYDQYAITRRFQTNETAINVIQGNISLFASQQEIEELKNGNKTMYSSIASLTVSLDSITTSISSSTYVDINGVLRAIDVNRSSITQVADQIELKVNKNGLIASINNSGEAVTIDASRINLNGAVTANGYFMIATDGSMYARKGTFWGPTKFDGASGAITLDSGMASFYGTGSAGVGYITAADKDGYFRISGTASASCVVLGGSSGGYSTSDIYLNFGLNPSGYTERVLFPSSTRFMSTPLFSYHLSLTDGYGLRSGSNTFLYKNGSTVVVGNDSFSTNIRGTAYANGGMIATTSDRNRKHNIIDLDERYEKLFDTLQPRLFKYNDGSSDRLHAGFIAQEVEESINNAGLTTQDFAAYVESPETITNVVEVVTESGEIEKREDIVETGDIVRALRYEEFISLNTYMIQKCLGEIDALKSRVTELEGR